MSTTRPGRIAALALAVLAATLLARCASAPGEAPSVDSALAGPGFSFAVIGDSGTGSKKQYAVARALEDSWRKDRFDLVVMLGDNIYEKKGEPPDFLERFEKPYETLLANGVKFRACLGNHDDAEAEIRYAPFNMEGRRYYTFRAGDGLLQFFALDTKGLDADQAAWLDREAGASTATWKIAFFHKPIYTSADRGPSLKARVIFEPIFVKHGVDVALSGHEHVYERLRPQNGVQYFISGGAGHVDRRTINRSYPDFVTGNDTLPHFMRFHATADALTFQAIAASGDVLDSGRIDASPGR